MGLQRNTKTEHNGAKNGGGFWGHRSEAKKTSNKLRRRNTQEETAKELNELVEEYQKAVTNPLRIARELGCTPGPKCGKCPNPCNPNPSKQVALGPDGYDNDPMEVW